MDLIEATPVVTAGETMLNEVFADFATKNPDSRERNEDYRVFTPVFEGPLDLLLHLIRKEQLNIYDIPISQICQTYLEHLDRMCLPDCNVAGEFFVMAATLLHLKSQILLPSEEQAEDDANDPRLPLVAQLLEYERFKKAADAIDALPWLERDIYIRPPTAANDIPVESLLDAPLDPVDTYQLLVNFKVALDRTERPPLQISADTTSLREKVETVGRYLEERGVIEFSNLIPPQHTRVDIVMSFLAILELARLKFIEILQTETFGPIQLRQVKTIQELNMGLLDQF